MCISLRQVLRIKIIMFRPGSILAHMENEFYLRNLDALLKLEQGAIDESEYRQLLEKSKAIFYGR